MAGARKQAFIFAKRFFSFFCTLHALGFTSWRRDDAELCREDEVLLTRGGFASGGGVRLEFDGR
jgi:hypothetical protein